MKPVKTEWIKKITALIYNRGWTFCSDTDKIIDQISEEFIQKDAYWLFDRLKKFSELIYNQNQTTYYKIGNNCQDFVKEAQRIIFEGLINSTDPNGVPIAPVDEEAATYCNRFLNSKAIKKHLDDLEYYDLAPKLMGNGISGFLEHSQMNEKNIISTYIAYAIVALRYFLTDLSEHRCKGLQPKLEYQKIEKLLHAYHARWLHYYLTFKIHAKKQLSQQTLCQPNITNDSYATSIFLV